MNIKKYLFIFPFFCFVVGYGIMYKTFTIYPVCAPNLIGKHVHEILPLLTQNNLNLRLIDQKEDSDVPEGIIINQTPASGLPIKPHQSIFVVTAKHPAAQQAPLCVGNSIDEITKLCTKKGITPRIYYVSHPHPQGTCFAQSPQPNEIVEKNRIFLYISSGNNKPIIWPTFIGKTEQEVTDFLNEYDMKAHIIYNSPQNEEPIVVDQRPTAGTLITLDDKKTIAIHLRVQ